MVGYNRVLIHFKKDILVAFGPELSWDEIDKYIDEQKEDVKTFSEEQKEFLEEISRVANNVFACTGTLKKIFQQWLTEIESDFEL